MYPATIHKRASAPSDALDRPAGPAERPGTQPRQAGHRHLVTGFARRLRALPASINFRQLAGPTAVFFLWPPRPRHSPATAAQDRTGTPAP